MEFTALERIEQLRGMEEFKALARRLRLVADNKGRLPMSRIRLPNYLFIEAPGCGVTTQLRLLTDLLEELRLTPFEGDRRCFGWVLDKNAFQPGGAFERLLDELYRMAGFHRQFKGVLGLEIDAWVDRPDAPELERLLALTDDVFGQVLFIFVVQARDDAMPEGLIQRLSADMPLEVVRCPLPGADDMAYYLSDFLLRRRFRVTVETVERLKAMMPALMAAEAFDGFQTLDNLADEIVYRFCAAEPRESDALVRPGDVAFIAEPGGYIDRLTRRNTRGSRRAIGFRTEEGWL